MFLFTWGYPITTEILFGNVDWVTWCLTKYFIILSIKFNCNSNGCLLHGLLKSCSVMHRIVSQHWEWHGIELSVFIYWTVVGVTSMYKFGITAVIMWLCCVDSVVQCLCVTLSCVTFWKRTLLSTKLGETFIKQQLYRERNKGRFCPFPLQ